jgi:glycosyltransferase involved in cell wall biosynthesis
VKLVVADPGPVPGLSPAAMQLLQSVDGLAQAGARVRLITPRPASGTAPEAVLGRPLHAGVITAHVADLRGRWFWPTRSSRPFYWQAVRELRRLRRSGEADAVLVRNLKLAEVLLRAPGVPPVFFETHELFAQSFREAAGASTGARARRARAIAAREGFVYRSVRATASLTRALADDIVATYGPVATIAVVPDGVDLELASAARRPRVAGPRPVLLYLGSLHRWKGVEIAVEAMTALAGCELRVAGGTDERIADLAACAARLGVADRVRLLGRVEPRRRFACIAEADICLLPLRTDAIAARYTSPLKLFEYMAMGKAIVASDLPSLREVLADRETALLVPSESPPALATAVRALLDEPALADALGRRAQAVAEERFGWPQRSARLLAMIERGLEGRAR